MLDGPEVPPYVAHTNFWSIGYDLYRRMLGHPSAPDELRMVESALEDLGAVAALAWT